PMALDATVGSYFGLSGVVAALIALLMVRSLRRANWRPSPWILLLTAGFVFKLAYETATGRVLIGFDMFDVGVGKISTVAHVAGVAVGIIVAFVGRPEEVDDLPPDGAEHAEQTEQAQGSTER